MMASDIVNELHTSFENTPFSISSDGSESKSKQLYPHTHQRYPDSDLEKVVTILIHLSECKEACTGANVFKIYSRNARLIFCFDPIVIFRYFHLMPVSSLIISVCS